ncbi:MAG: alpha-galactosidase [Prolixibacteraceae bacterium]|nr:alpha-galactosidase [Prolixibacteraceae bacterium]
MKKCFLRASFLLAYLFIFISIGIARTLPESRPRSEINRWIDQHFAAGKIPPFSFVYGGESSNSFIRNWRFSSEKLPSTEQNAVEMLYTYSDSKSGLVVRCQLVAFADFPAVEWTLKFFNGSEKNSGVIEKAAAIDYSFESDKAGSFILHHAKGSSGERNDFQPYDDKLQVGKHVYMTPSAGRSSDNTALPFFNLEMPAKKGVMVAVGWTGKWYADIVQTNETNVSLKSGMERMQLSLLPGEEIRTPKICLLFWKGEDRMEGHNQFRRFILTHHSRKVNGHFAEYPLSGSFDYGDPAPCNEYECLTEEYAVALVKRYQQFNVLPELFWLDAGWYTGCNGLKQNGGWWQNAGNWSADKERFPKGLRPVADVVHQTGAKFMVWFEPERVHVGTQLANEHPEWLIKLPNNDEALLDLGNKEALAWITQHISNLLRQEGIDYYRQDFNFDPMPYWMAHDKPGRIGISEIRHIEGLYAYWDSLLKISPNLLIDNCSSGGRRIDLETTSRSAPLWRTDYQYGESNGYQCHTYGLNFYLPIHGTAIYRTDNYTFRSGLGGTAVTNWEITGRNSEPIPAIQKRLQDFKKLRPYFYGDYYPLTESLNYTQDNIWLAYQLNRPEHKDGIVLAFRRNEAANESIIVRLCGLDPVATYELYDEDRNINWQKTGRELMESIELSIPQKPSSLMIIYRKL